MTELICPHCLTTKRQKNVLGFVVEGCVIGDGRIVRCVRVSLKCRHCKTISEFAALPESANDPLDKPSVGAQATD